MPIIGGGLGDEKGPDEKVIRDTEAAMRSARQKRASIVHIADTEVAAGILLAVTDGVLSVEIRTVIPALIGGAIAAGLTVDGLRRKR